MLFEIPKKQNSVKKIATTKNRMIKNKMALIDDAVKRILSEKQFNFSLKPEH